MSDLIVLQFDSGQLLDDYSFDGGLRVKVSAEFLDVLIKELLLLSV